jgi:hypothetical protein
MRKGFAHLGVQLEFSGARGGFEWPTAAVGRPAAPSCRARPSGRPTRLSSTAAEHGKGSFRQLMFTNAEEATKYYDDFQKNESSRTVKTQKTTLSSDISIDTKKISKINRDVLTGDKDLSNSIPNGKVFKHEIGHFLYSIFKKAGMQNKQQSSEDKAKETENTFDGKPETQTKTDDFPK